MILIIKQMRRVRCIAEKTLQAGVLKESERLCLLCIASGPGQTVALLDVQDRPGDVIRGTLQLIRTQLEEIGSRVRESQRQICSDVVLILLVCTTTTTTTRSHDAADHVGNGGSHPCQHGEK